jgi:hypothetical protein
MRSILAVCAWLIVGLYLVATSEEARGFVLCVSADGHVRVEDYETAVRCCKSGDGLACAGPNAPTLRGDSCVDTALRGTACPRSAPPWNPASPITVTIRWDAPDLESQTPLTSRHRQLDPACRALRTVVLLI